MTSYYFPPELKGKGRFATIVVIDSFPPPTPRELKFSRYQDLYEKYNEDDLIDQFDRAGLRTLQRNLALTDVETKEIEARAATEAAYSDSRARLGSHSDFGALKKSLKEAIIELTGYKEKNDHGFHVAGIISAQCNGFGIAGMQPFASAFAYQERSS